MKFDNYTVEYSNEGILIVWVGKNKTDSRIATPLEELMFKRLQVVGAWVDSMKEPVE